MATAIKNRTVNDPRGAGATVYAQSAPTFDLGEKAESASNYYNVYYERMSRLCATTPDLKVALPPERPSLRVGWQPNGGLRQNT